MTGTRSTMRDMLAAGGEVGHDLLAVDWSTTSVGDPDDWPLSLRSAVRILLTSKFSMWMAWGEDLTFFCNAAYRRDTLGDKYPWALGRPTREVWSEIWTDIEPMIARVMATGEATWDEALFLFLERNGYVEETYHTFSYSPLGDDDGDVVGMLCVVTEVTDQVVAERRMSTLRELGIAASKSTTQDEAMRAACAHLAKNPQSIPFAAVYLFDDEGAARLAGTAGIAAGHAAAPELIGVDDVDPWPVEQLWAGRTATVGELSDRFADLPSGGWSEPPQTALLVPLANATGPHPFGFLLVGANRYRPVDDSYHAFVGLVASHLSAAVGDARAITAERERAEALARLDQAKSDFLANVSHELRTPLTLLLGPAEDALADAAHPLGDVQRRRTEVVLRNGQRMLQLVNTLLDFSRLESGENDARYLPTDLMGLTAELAAMFEAAADRAGLVLTVVEGVEGLDAPDGPGDAMRAWVDREQWAKIVFNLLSNALKFTFEGGIEVRVHHEPTRHVLTVTDTGTGIPAAEQSLLFERFHRVVGARSRTHEGSGIGLALVAQLAQAHGGDVDVVSEVGRGTTFTVWVPTGHEHLPPDQVGDGDGSSADATGVAERQRARVANTGLWLEGVEHDLSAVDPTAEETSTILVADDNADMRRYVAGLLTDAGHRVVTVADGTQALEQMRHELPDLLITDVMMPNLDGFGLLRAVRSEERLAAVPVVMLSARAGEEGMVEGLDAGADDYLVKPFSARELLARVRVHLALDRAARVRRSLERSEALLDQAQRLARIGSWEVDLAADTIVASSMFLDLVEHTAEDLERLGAQGVVAALVHPEDRDRVLETLGAARPGDRIDYETRVILPSGGERLFAVLADVIGPTQSSLEVLRGSFQDITEQRATQQRLLAAAADREAVAREREVADELQRSLLPSRTIDVEPLEVATYYHPGTEGTQVGGDWYDVVDLGAGRIAVVIGDVMGRGVKAAAVMGQVRAAVLAFARVDLAPADLLEYLDGIVADLSDDQIVTCVYAVLDSKSMQLSYASAGHPPVLVAREAELVRLDSTGPPLGAGFFGVSTRVVDIEPGDTLMLYTDGLVERPSSDLFADIDRLARLVGASRALPAAEQLTEVLAAMTDGPNDDDVAIVVAKVRGTTNEATLRRRLDGGETAPGAARRLVSAHLASWGVPRDLADDVLLAVSELVTNALVHARAPIDLRLEWTGTELLLEVQDRTSLRPRRQRPTDVDEGGRGLNIVDALATAWGTRRTSLGKAVWASF